eukprot:SAG11_NODE_1136_length_5731_cov_23.656250_2_plen_55_part_00
MYPLRITAGTLGHGTKIRYISFPDVHNLYSSLSEPKLLDHGTKVRNTHGQGVIL